MMGDYKQITLANLATIDDQRLSIAFDQAIKRAASDCNDRPADKRVRTVNLQVELKPVQDDDGMCDEVMMKVQIKDAIPTRKSKDYSLALRQNGIIAIRDGSEDNHRQSVLPIDDDTE